MINIFLILFIFISACTSRQNYQKKNLEGIYQGAGVETYFLPSLPEWANYDRVAQCRREKRFQYFDFEKIQKSLALDYFKFIQLQLAYNIKLESFRGQSSNNLAPKDESYLFYNMKEKVEGGAYEFYTPDFNRLHLVWIDPLISDKRSRQLGKNRLRNLLNQKKFNMGFPIIVSLCLSFGAMEKYLTTAGLDDRGIRIISAEMFSPFSREGQLTAHMQLDIRSLLGSDKAIYLYSPAGASVPALKGKYQLVKF